MAASRRNWQEGLNPSKQINAILNNKKLGGKETWKVRRELTCPKWSEAFLKAVKDATGADRFTHVTAVTCMAKGKNKAEWENHRPFQRALHGNPIRIITLSEMINEIGRGLTKTLATTEVGRMLQFLYAAGIITRPDRSEQHACTCLAIEDKDIIRAKDCSTLLHPCPKAILQSLKKHCPDRNLLGSSACLRQCGLHPS